MTKSPPEIAATFSVTPLAVAPRIGTELDTALAIFQRTVARPPEGCRPRQWRLLHRPGPRAREATCEIPSVLSPFRPWPAQPHMGAMVDAPRASLRHAGLAHALDQARERGGVLE